MNLKALTSSGLLREHAITSSRRDQIFISFTPFMFVHAHGLGLLERYDIRYVEQDELDDPESNPVYATAMLELYEYYEPLFDLQPSNHDSRTTYTMNSMLAKGYLFITKPELKQRLLNTRIDVKKIR